MFNETLKNEEHIFYIGYDSFAWKQNSRCIRVQADAESGRIPLNSWINKWG